MNYTITTIDEYVSLLKKSNSIDQHSFYRGHSNVAYKLKPSVGRFRVTPPELTGADGDNYHARRDFERRMLEAFKSRAYPYLEYVPENDLEWLLLAQHHSLPTRLLDWTQNPLVGLYFAVENLDKNHDACVIQVRNLAMGYLHGISGPQSMDLATPEFDPFKGLPVTAFMLPSHRHRRYTNQNSIVSLHPNLEVEYTRDIAARYIIPAKSKQQLKNDLYYLGINQTFIYPGLDSVGKDVSNEFKALFHIE